MLSQTAEYALRAVVCLAADNEDFVTASALASAARVPPDYLSKVLQQLSAAGLVRGRRGVGGGYKLARAPGAITVFDVVQALGVSSRVPACPLDGEVRNLDMCALHRTLDRALQAAEAVFKRTSLADLIGDPAYDAGPLCAAAMGIEGESVADRQRRLHSDGDSAQRHAPGRPSFATAVAHPHQSEPPTESSSPYGKARRRDPID